MEKPRKPASPTFLANRRKAIMEKAIERRKMAARARAKGKDGDKPMPSAFPPPAPGSSPTVGNG